MLPKEWINEDGVGMNYQFFKYAAPLIKGEVEVPFEHGIPNTLASPGTASPRNWATMLSSKLN